MMDEDIETYKWRVSPDCGGTKIGGDYKCCLMSWNAFLHFEVHLNYLLLRRSKNKGKDSSPDLERKWLIDVIHSLSLNFFNISRRFEILNSCNHRWV